MQTPDVVSFLKEAGMQGNDLKGLLNQSVLGLRKRTPRQKTQRHEKNEDHPHRPQVKQAAKKPSERLSRQQFQCTYLSFRKGKPRQAQDWQHKNMDLLFSLHDLIVRRQGYLEIISNGELGSVVQSLKIIRPEFSQITVQKVQQIYLQHLLQFDSYLIDKSKPLTFKKGVSPYHSLRMATFYSEDNHELLTDIQKQTQILEQDIVVIEGFVKNIGLQEINLELINKQHGHELVDLRIQNPMDYGFNYTKLMNKGDKMTISQYCEYQKIYDDEAACKQKFGDKLKGGKIMFAVNFQPSEGSMINLLKEKLDQTMFGWAGPKDILSYLQQHINGCTNPQFYLKVKGCWTGGHQENISMCAININHGPASSEWYTVPVQQVQRLRITLKEKFKLDLYDHEGLWFEKANWFIQNGFQIKRILQKAGDMVVSGPGTLHWVRSFGIALHSAWNIFSDSYKSWANALHRQIENKKIRFRKSNTIPLNTLALKHIDHSFNTMPSQTLELLIDHLTFCLTSETKMLAEIEIHKESCKVTISERYLQEHECFCEICLQEVFMYYTLDTSASKVYCLTCQLELLISQPVPSLNIYHKFDKEKMKQFLILAQAKKLDPNSVRYCSGEHIGMQCKSLGKQSGEAEAVSQSTSSETFKIGGNLLTVTLKSTTASQTDPFMQLKRPFKADRQSAEAEPAPKKRKNRHQTNEQDLQQGQIKEEDRIYESYTNNRRSKEKNYNYEDRPNKEGDYDSRGDYNYNRRERQRNYDRNQGRYRDYPRQDHRNRDNYDRQNTYNKSQEKKYYGYDNTNSFRERKPYNQNHNGHKKYDDSSRYRDQGPRRNNEDHHSQKESKYSNPEMTQKLPLPPTTDEIFDY